MKEFLKKNWFFKSLVLFVLINITLVIYNSFILKQRKYEYRKFLEKQRLSSEQPRFIPNTNVDFYGLPCPELTEYSATGEKIDLKSYIGNIILIRFSRFYRQDLANLVYLQHLADKYHDQNVSLIFISSLGIYDKEAVEKIVKLTSPIIEDDGLIAAMFNAFPEDLIIVDRNFTIKFKFHRASSFLIYDEVTKWTFKEQPRNILITNDNLARTIQNLAFYDIFNEEKRKINPLHNKSVVLTLFTSACTGCEESYRIDQLKKLAGNVNIDKFEIIILFGKGNNKEAIKQYAIQNKWDEFPITIGVIDDFNEMTEMEYYQIYQLDTDPKSFIINPLGDIRFIETRRASKLINSNFLKRQLK